MEKEEKPQGERRQQGIKRKKKENENTIRE